MSLTTEIGATLDRLRSDAGLDVGRLDVLEGIADTLPEQAVAEAIAAAQVRLPDHGVHPSLHYLLARLAARGGERETAVAVLDRLLERLNQDGQHALLIEVARRNADWLPVERLIPLVVRAARAEPEALAEDVLEEMLGRYPEDPRLHWLAGLRGLGSSPETGSGPAASLPPALPATLAHLARALPFLARENESPFLEEAALPVIENLDETSAREVVAMLAALIQRRRIDEASTYLELSLSGLLAHGQAPSLWDLLRNTLVRDPAAAPLRPAALAALRELPGQPPSHARVIVDSGLADPAVPFSAAIARHARLMEFPPGEYVEHRSWGVGEIVAYDGEDLTVRFLGRPEHVFKRTLADRALERLGRDDLRVLQSFFPERLAELKDRDPAGLVAVALRGLGGQGKPRDLKRLLTPAAVPAEEWTDWWRKARVALEEDERIDLSQSFRDTLRLVGEISGAAGGTAAQVPLPHLAAGDAARQLKLLRRFLDQHPDARDRVDRAYRRLLERWLETRPLTDEERLLILILIAGWDPAGRSRLRDHLVEACRGGFSLATFPAASDQMMLFELGLEGPDWKPVAMAALDSRELAARERALAVVDERLGPVAVDFYRAVLEGSPVRGDAVIEVARVALGGRSEAAARVPAVDIFIALLKQVSEPGRETLRKQAQALLAADGPVFARLAAEPAAGPGAEQVALALLSFHASDNHLFPILAALETIWGPTVVAAFRRRRERETRRITARMEDEGGEPPLGLMTRASFNSLRAEIERVDLELRTTIPRAIQHARELGDLRESGEYESAKLKQRQASDRLLLLQRRLAEAQIIEDFPVDDSFVAAGTEVVLSPVEGGEPIIYWVLGDGDSWLGPEVVSYRAELGRALWRKRPGEELEVPFAGGRRRVRIEQIRRRLPPAESQP